MDKKYQIAYSEALLIINNSEQEIKNKIPKSFIKFLEDNKDSEYTPNFNFDEDDWFEKLTPETKAVVALIYRDYVATPEDKEAFIKDQNDKLIQAEEELRKKYNPDDIFKNNQVSQPVDNDDSIHTDNQLVEYKEGFFKKLINKILAFLKIK